MLKAAKAYLTTQVTTTSQGEVLLLLYEAAIKNLRQAQEKIKERNYAAKGVLISKALDIISELSESLNAEKGGDLARNLHSLYFFCSTRLLKANLKMDPALIDEVIHILDGIRSAFAEIIPAQEGRAPKAAGPAKPAVPFPTAGPRPAGPAPVPPRSAPPAAPLSAPAPAPQAAPGLAASGPAPVQPAAPALAVPDVPAPDLSVQPGPQVGSLVNPLARRAQAAYAAPRLG